MSSFSVPVKRIRVIAPHPNADRLELVHIDGYCSAVRKGQFKVGDLVAYIPEGSVLPETLLKMMGLWNEDKGCGTLAGKEGNRVKAVRLRGILSQGVCYAMNTNLPGHTVQEGGDAADLLGITKYVPPVPACLDGEVFDAGIEFSLNFDIENWKSWPDILCEGEEVVFTEKLHGSCTIVVILPYNCAKPEAFGERKNILVCSKRRAINGQSFVCSSDIFLKNNYLKALQPLLERIDILQRDDCTGPEMPLYLLGETYGPDIQDLHYDGKLSFRVFAAVRGLRTNQTYCNWSEVDGELKTRFGYDTVPVLYSGPFSRAALEKYTGGSSTLSNQQIREGIVITPVIERMCPEIGRVCLKSISPSYLSRKGGTEYN